MISLETGDSRVGLQIQVSGFLGSADSGLWARTLAVRCQTKRIVDDKQHTIGPYINTDTILVVPYYNCSIT